MRGCGVPRDGRLRARRLPRGARAVAHTFARWQACGLCKNAYQGSTAMALATAAWATYVSAPEHDDRRLSAQGRARRAATRGRTLRGSAPEARGVPPDVRPRRRRRARAPRRDGEPRALLPPRGPRRGRVAADTGRPPGAAAPAGAAPPRDASGGSNLAGLLLSRGERRRGVASCARRGGTPPASRATRMSALRLTYNIAHALRDVEPRRGRGARRGEPGPPESRLRDCASERGRRARTRGPRPRASPRKPPDRRIPCSVLSHVKHGQAIPGVPTHYKPSSEINTIAGQYHSTRPQFLDRGMTTQAAFASRCRASS